MTKDEAISILRRWKNIGKNGMTSERLGYIEGWFHDYDVEAFEMAINALKQEHILDKIEKEINSPNRGTCDYFIVDRIEEIINKYKAESEEV